LLLSLVELSVALLFGDGLLFVIFDADRREIEISY
jgi:hypothetical protein